MKIGILGTGVVGQTLGTKLVALGHEVMLGTRDTSKLQEWLGQMGGQAKAGSFAEAAAHGEIVFNATQGTAALQAIQLAGESNLNDKILVDVSNPLDFSHGMPPTLSVSNTDSLGEQIQRAFPKVKVVKTLNTVTADLMVNPGQLAQGDHHLFISGNEAAAKAQVVDLLTNGFGWKQVIDLGDITTARATEMILPLWVRLYGVLQTPLFNFKLIK